MSISNSSSKINISSYWAIVWSLNSWESRTWPSVRSSWKAILCLEKNIFLFNSEPWLFIRFSIKNLFCKFSEICVIWSKLFESSICPWVSLTKNHYVITSSERIREIIDWFNNNLWAFCSGLICWWTIIIPLR